LLDCMHWEWKNCPPGWAGNDKGKEKVRFLWFWFGINTDKSPFQHTETHNCPWSRFLPWLVAMACFLWYPWLPERHHHSWALAALLQSHQRHRSLMRMHHKWSSIH
jgi:hypothetical protein